MALAADRDLVARQYANGFREVLGEALPVLRESLNAGRPIETAIVTAYLHLLARHPDSLIARKSGLDRGFGRALDEQIQATGVSKVLTIADVAVAEFDPAGSQPPQS